MTKQSTSTPEDAILEEARSFARDSLQRMESAQKLLLSITQNKMASGPAIDRAARSRAVMESAQNAIRTVLANLG